MSMMMLLQGRASAYTLWPSVSLHSLLRSLSVMCLVCTRFCEPWISFIPSQISHLWQEDGQWMEG